MKAKIALPAALTLAVGAGTAHGQGGYTTKGGGWYGGWMVGDSDFWIPILPVVVVGLLAWILTNWRK